LIICPACGSSVDEQLCLGCSACGARAVGPPLAKPEYQLKSYGSAILAAVGGGVMLAGFLAATTVAWIITYGAALSFGAFFAAGQSAAWQLKWFSLPVTVAVIWIGLRSVRAIQKAPADFGGLRIARGGFGAAILATLLIATSIGVTVPERLRRRQWALQAAENAQAYTLSRAMLEYRDLHGTLPSQEDLVRELRTLPDPNGSIAEALQRVPPDGYEAIAVVAAAASTKGKTLPRGAAVRNASLTTASEVPAVSFTSYQLRLPGPDKKINTEDDLIIRDGLVMTVAEFQEFKTRSIEP
jgi:hypothetical protein